MNEDGSAVPQNLHCPRTTLQIPRSMAPEPSAVTPAPGRLQERPILSALAGQKPRSFGRAARSNVGAEHDFKNADNSATDLCDSTRRRTDGVIVAALRKAEPDGDACSLHRRSARALAYIRIFDSARPFMKSLDCVSSG